MDQRTALEADAARVEAAMSEVDPDKLAPLIREHRLLLSELASLPSLSEVSAADEIAKRRAARRSDPKRSPRAKRSS